MGIDIYKILYFIKNLIEGEQVNRDAGISQILLKARRSNKEHNRNRCTTCFVRLLCTGTGRSEARTNDDLSLWEQWIDPYRRSRMSRFATTLCGEKVAEGS